MNTGELTEPMLAGTPVGTPDGMVICDSCNKQIITARRLANDEDTDTTVHVYATGDSHQWALRWTSCSDCGPIADGDPSEAGEAFATATLTPDPTHDQQVMIDDVTITACAPPKATIDR